MAQKKPRRSCSYFKASGLCQRIRRSAVVKMNPSIDNNKVLVFSGAGVSAESGLDTFRGSGGFWYTYRIQDVCHHWQAGELIQSMCLSSITKESKAFLKLKPNASHKAYCKAGR